jgi:hypothetical protein
MARRGFSVTFTVYMNQWLFSGNPDYSAGNSDYDHIVSLCVLNLHTDANLAAACTRLTLWRRFSWSSSHDDDAYHDDDVLTFSDHGLWNDQPKQQPP